MQIGIWAITMSQSKVLAHAMGRHQATYFDYISIWIVTKVKKK